MPTDPRCSMTAGVAANCEHWEEWQRAYRFGVLLILPPEPLRSEVNALRSRYDPRSQSFSGAHISLTVPLQREPTGSDWAELEAAALAIRPFSIRYGPLKDFLPKPGAALHIEPQHDLDKLRGQLEACGVFAGAPPRTYKFWAHMTIAEFISAGETEALVAELANKQLSGSFLCDGVWHTVPDENFRFSEHRKLSFRQ